MTTSGSVATSRPSRASTLSGNAANATGRWVDDRLGSSNFVRRSLNKVFPDHWSFMLGEIALYSFIILLLSGTYLAFFYTPSLAEVVYDGSFTPLVGVEMSEAYESTLNIAFDVRGGLIMRQIHHWAALLFVVSIVVHLMRVFFTGAFRKPRELNWVIGVLLLILAILEGFAGYSLPDDLLSGTGLRIAWSIMLAVPVVGTWVAFLFFGAEYPGTEFLDRLYIAHVFIVPLILLGLITAHMMMIWYQKHTQFAGPGRTEENVVGSRLYPAYAAKAGGFFFLVFAVLAAMGGLFQINPVWLYGPYNPSQVTAGSQPDWYVGWLDGATRLMPGWEVSGLGHTLAINVIVPAVVIPGLIFTLMLAYPWLEQRFTGDRDFHHILDRPRDAPVRTAIGAMSLSFYLVLWISGGNDVIASIFDISVNHTTYAGRIALLLLPPVVYVITKRICIGLQESDKELVHHGIESGTIRRLPSGEFVEETVPLPVPYRLALNKVEPSEPGHGNKELASGEPVPHGAPSDGGHGDMTQWVDTEPKSKKGFLRDKSKRRAAERPEPTRAELEGSGQQ
ncbi:MAG TPA: cytochrome bc complex cytochrome b subunit [Mycobacteriales bacterium]|nr:cytochrome bc complex cytochrome b subunit [Mycobacteriales bacterium]